MCLKRTSAATRITCLIIVLIGLSSCGYKFQGSGTSLPQDIKTIAVAGVDNETLTPGLGREVEESLRTMIESFGALQLVSEDTDADAILRASIKRLSNEVKNVTGANDVALEYDLIILVAAELRRPNGQLLWRNSGLTARESYASTSDVVVTSGSSFAQGGLSGGSLQGLESNELARGQARTALNDLIEEVARRVYLEAVAEDF